jgi:glycosyltransferase involved in cell wall biosynthesis
VTDDADPAPELSAIVLCYRAGESVRRLVEALQVLLDAAVIDYEIVLVANDWPDSGDVTAVVVAELAETDPRIRPVVLEKQGAMGWDMRSGLAAARGRYLIVMDGDAQNPISDVLRMYRKLSTGGFDVMKGRRVRRFDGTYREVISLLYNVAFRIFFRTTGLWDINGKPKGLTRAAYEAMHLHSDDWFIDAEIVLAARRLGLKLGELPVVFHTGERGSFVKPGAIWEFVENMVLYRLRFRGRR